VYGLISRKMTETNNSDIETNEKQIPEPFKVLPSSLKLELVDETIVVRGKSYEHKDRLKAGGARWNPNKKVWYFDINDALRLPLNESNPEWTCCWFAKDIDLEKQTFKCPIDCYKKRQIESGKIWAERNKKLLEEEKNQNRDKYILVFGCRSGGETDYYAVRYDTLEECQEKINKLRQFLNKCRHTPFEMYGTLWYLYIHHNGSRMFLSDSSDEYTYVNDELSIREYLDKSKFSIIKDYSPPKYGGNKIKISCI